ncbi:pseudouridine-metabolizing bifunctional protein [Blastocystis sp. subtype 4]|uniref:pseudouridine-metabolizing bifunctional protein n=1 Tax=Blastocystis sp. subtype 4 TaxID=944170 RepID=UPI000711B834|nr:pseudouridine-metabolizing bifunctional protein [Blastocystis sp. subtype 4]KNB42692.1 pseudouridine-metabolizing bifunctional protein [Blastocystis sp. subtype 4]|eukprot:XP_014526135.1 pseudouridine-metabolizing bifunctional protein [Blastocystis sp. subtype 4]
MLNRLGRNLCLSHISGCIGLQRSISIQRRCVSTLSSPFRIGEHLGNIENKGSPFVLIETSFLTKFSKPSSSLKALRYIENTVRKNGAIPVSLGMIDGEVIIGLNNDEMKLLCSDRKHQFCCHRSNLSHYTTQKTTAFIAPSAAVFYSIYLFNSRHISSLYGIPIILSGEIEGFPCDFKEKTTPYQDLVSLENTETILLPLGFHPYQNIQKSIDFAAKKNIHVITFNSPTIPSTLGCASSVVSPENVTSEETLLETVSRFLDQRQPSIDIQNELVSIHQHLVSKRVPEFSLTQLSQKFLFREKSIPAFQAFYEEANRNASLAARLAVFISRKHHRGGMSPPQKKGRLTSSPTYSIFAIGHKDMEQGVECVLLDMMQDVFRDETKGDDLMRSTVENSLAIQTILSSAVGHPSVSNTFEKPIPLPSLSYSPKPIIKGSPLPRPKAGSATFITSTYLTHNAIMSKDQRHLDESWLSAGMRSHLLYTIYTSLTRESPPLHVSIRSNDEHGKKLASLVREMGDTDYGTTIVNNRITPQGSILYDVEGHVISRSVSDEMIRQAGNEFVLKHKAMIEKSSLIVTDAGMNESILKYVCKVCDNRGIPLFFEMADHNETDRILNTHILSHAQWVVQSPETLFQLDYALTNRDSMAAWNKLKHSSFVTPQSILDIVYSPCMTVLKEMKTNSTTNSQHLLLTLPPFGECVINSGSGSTSMSLLISPPNHGPFADVAFESGFLWGIMNQYPLDLSMSLGLITQVQVNQTNSLFGKTLHNSIFANQIMKYMTGINSFDIF